MDTDKFVMPPWRAKTLKRPGPRAAGFSPSVSMPGQVDAGDLQFTVERLGFHLARRQSRRPPEAAGPFGSRTMGGFARCPWPARRRWAGRSPRGHPASTRPPPTLATDTPSPSASPRRARDLRPTAGISQGSTRREVFPRSASTGERAGVRCRNQRLRKLAAQWVAHERRRIGDGGRNFLV